MMSIESILSIKRNMASIDIMDGMDKLSRLPVLKLRGFR